MKGLGQNKRIPPNNPKHKKLKDSHKSLKGQKLNWTLIVCVPINNMNLENGYRPV